MRDPALAPSSDDRQRWHDADQDARPQRLGRLRERMVGEGVDAYFGLGAENARYLTGFELGDGEDKVRGSSGRFLVGADEVIVIADSRYRLQAEEQCRGARIEPFSTGFPQRFRELLAGLRSISGEGAGGVRRVAVEATNLSHAEWQAIVDEAPELELVPSDGWVEGARATKEPSELERIGVACAIADRALEETLADIVVGASERDLALALEWRMRTGGADALAFDVACLAGSRAALPHGSPGERMVQRGEVLLFDFGAQVAGYRSDMTRTLFVGEPTSRDRSVYELVARAQEASLSLLADTLAAGNVPTNREVDAAARDVIEAAGHGDHFGHGTGHGIGLATHERPSVGRAAVEAVLPSPTVFSVEPGVYLDGKTGVRIEDLVAVDVAASEMRRLTGFTRDITVVAA